MTAAADQSPVPAPGSGEAAPSNFWALTIGSVGVVYGDIGTSPLYALREAVTAAVGHDANVTRDAVFGVLSLILWALVIVVTVKYVLILLRADNKGEGGTLALMALAQRAVGRNSVAIVLCGIISAALFYGDAVITPALSVLSAIEGLKVVAPSFEHFVMPLTIVILVGLFAVQSHGTARVAALVRTDHRDLVHRDRGFRRLSYLRQPGSSAGLQSRPCGELPVLARRHRPDHARRGVPGGHRRGSALRRPRPFRAKADPDRLVRAGAARARHQLSRAGRAGAGQPQGARESVLPDVPGLGAHPDGAARHRRHRDRQPGGDHRRLFDHPSGDPARPDAAARNPPHLGLACRADLHAAGEHAAAGRCAAAGAAVPLVERARLRLRHRRHRHDGGDRNAWRSW